MFIEMHCMPPDELDRTVAGILRDILSARDAWSLTLEGEWEEYCKPGGVYYLPEIPWSDDDGGGQAAMFLRDFVEELEQRAYDVGIIAYADGEAGVYRFEGVTETGEEEGR